MGLKLDCDGCGCDVTPETMETVGRLAPAFYCRGDDIAVGCLEKWKAYQAEEDAERVRVVEDFARWRAERMEALRKTLGRLPDE